MKTLFFIISLFIVSPAVAQMAVETMPGVTFYGSDTMAVETMPGVRFFSGAVTGSAIETMPGVTFYHLNEDAAFVQDLIDQGNRREADQRLSSLEYENRRLREQVGRSTRPPWER